MIIMKKHIAIIILVMITVILVIFGIKKHESRQTFNNSDIKIVLDAGHGGYVKCFNRLGCNR